ncbi:class II aldolase/adducin family protein [Enterocloster lavalensis]|uniref:class II aldolase/adducin family protein n=1 Tax=Enterocloster lavalensis TaxID=460384 RepID=UPI001D07B93A|nr:class II aldolase/adducin family protein [Enterocloster lavalensis]MCB6342367.1 class II aldolase/adducin family protein [Enterocloster lavalensis]
MKPELQAKITEAIWVGESLFCRGKTAGSSANLSFRHEDYIYITGSGTCFGKLTQESFSRVDMNGRHIDGIAPSKELPLHFMLYKQSEKVQAVIHTHSFYSTLWSCLEHECEEDCIPSYTPYLKMKLGTVGLVPYAKPGSKELFAAFAACMNRSDGYLLKNHGPIVADKDLMSAFYCLEELEESAHIAWELRNEKNKFLIN